MSQNILTFKCIKLPPSFFLGRSGEGTFPHTFAYFTAEGSIELGERKSLYDIQGPKFWLINVYLPFIKALTTAAELHYLLHHSGRKDFSTVFLHLFLQLQRYFSPRVLRSHIRVKSRKREKWLEFKLQKIGQKNAYSINSVSLGYSNTITCQENPPRQNTAVSYYHFLSKMYKGHPTMQQFSAESTRILGELSKPWELISTLIKNDSQLGIIKHFTLSRRRKVGRANTCCA